jgi:hypothetical protein
LRIRSERVAGAPQAPQLAIESAAATLLERSLQPSRLPRLPRIQLGARFITAESRLIGGDWYDAFTVPSGQLWLIVGDVARHGLNAAVVMGGSKARFAPTRWNAIHHKTLSSAPTARCGTSRSAP